MKLEESLFHSSHRLGFDRMAWLAVIQKVVASYESSQLNCCLAMLSCVAEDVFSSSVDSIAVKSAPGTPIPSIVGGNSTMLDLVDGIHLNQVAFVLPIRRRDSRRFESLTLDDCVS